MQYVDGEVDRQVRVGFVVLVRSVGEAPGAAVQYGAERFT